MAIYKQPLAVLAATAWISVSEFLRNQIIFPSYWIDHYKHLGLVFPSQPVNGAAWGLWSLLFALLIYFLSSKFSLIQTALIGWLAAFAMMWVAIGNLGVLPWGLLWFAVPLSLLESFVAAFIVRKIGAVN